MTTALKRAVPLLASISLKNQLNERFGHYARFSWVLKMGVKKIQEFLSSPFRSIGIITG